MNDFLAIINPVLVALSSSIIILGSVITMLRRKSDIASMFKYEVHVKTRNGFEIHRKAENEHLAELKAENKKLKAENLLFRKEYGPFTFWQKVKVFAILIITLPIGLLLLVQLKLTRK